MPREGVFGVGEPVVVVVVVSPVVDAVPVGVRESPGVEREVVQSVEDAVAVVVNVDVVAEPVAVGVDGVPAIEGHVVEVVGDAVAVVVGVGTIADAVAIGVQVFRAVGGEAVEQVGDAVGVRIRRAVRRVYGARVRIDAEEAAPAAEVDVAGCVVHGRIAATSRPHERTAAVDAPPGAVVAKVAVHADIGDEYLSATQRADLGGKSGTSVRRPFDVRPSPSAVRGRSERVAAGTPEQVPVPRHRVDKRSLRGYQGVPVVAGGGPDMADVQVAGEQVAGRVRRGDGLGIDQALPRIGSARDESERGPGCTAVAADVHLAAARDVAREIDATVSVGNQSGGQHRMASQCHWRKGPALVGRHVQRVPVKRERVGSGRRVRDEQGAVDRVDVADAYVDRGDRFECPSAVDAPPERGVEARRLPHDPEGAVLVHRDADDVVHGRHARHVREVGFLWEPGSVHHPVQSVHGGHVPGGAVSAVGRKVAARFQPDGVAPVSVRVQRVGVEEVACRALHEDPEAVLEPGRRRPDGVATVEASALREQAAAVARAEAWNELVEEARSLRTAPEEHPVVVDLEPASEVGLEQFVDQRLVLGIPVADAASGVPVPQQRALRVGRSEGHGYEAERRGVPLHIGKPRIHELLLGAGVVAVKEQQYALGHRGVLTLREFVAVKQCPVLGVRERRRDGFAACRDRHHDSQEGEQHDEARRRARARRP